jgi:hypothetical protein
MSWVAAAGACAIAFGALAVTNRLRQRRRMSKPGGHSQADFIASFEGDQIPAELLKVTYEYLRKCLPAAFPVDPTDDLGKVYGMYEEDLDDAVTTIASAANRSLTSVKETKDSPPVRTVEDLVRFVASLPPAS